MPSLLKQQTYRRQIERTVKQSVPNNKRKAFCKESIAIIFPVFVQTIISACFSSLLASSQSAFRSEL